MTLVNGVAEEVFFRGGALRGDRPPAAGADLHRRSTPAATFATGNPMLVFAALTLGLVLALQRRASGGILAPIITHVTWSMLMLYLLPPLFAHH